MRYGSLLVSAVLVGLVCAGGAQAGDDGRRGGRNAFVGLWQAIDSFDGSTQRLSITCDGRKDCDVRLNDTFFGLSCPNPPYTGFARGKGTIKRNVLTVVLTLRCEGASEAASQPNEFVLDRRNGTLTNLNDDFDALPPTDVPPALTPNVFHKVSR